MKLEMKPVYLLLGGVWLGILLLLLGTTGVHQNTLVGTAAQIDAISPATGTLALVTDGESTIDCDTGGGAEDAWCYWDGSAWEPVAGFRVKEISRTDLSGSPEGNLTLVLDNDCGRWQIRFERVGIAGTTDDTLSVRVRTTEHG